jgi:hypothetical protein
MSFLIPAQTISCHRHNKHPIYETWIGVGVGVMAVGTAGSLGMGLASASKKTPGYNAPSTYDKLTAQQGLIDQSASSALKYAPIFTKQNIALQDIVSPGASAQRKLANRQLDQYIQGQIPQDVQQQINRQVAQNLGGGFNLYSGGGQAPQNFARNLGQTSLGLSQYGLSAAPTWQQLANSMVASPTSLFTPMMQGGIATTENLTQQSQNQYQAGMNQYGAQQAGMQGIQQGLGSLASAGGAIMSAGMMSNYLNGLRPSSSASYNPCQGYMNTMMGTGYSNPAATTQFAQRASQIPSAYSGGASYASGLNPALAYTNPITF